jgi:hypothetical protein
MNLTQVSHGREQAWNEVLHIDYLYMKYAKSKGKTYVDICALLFYNRRGDSQSSFAMFITIRNGQRARVRREHLLHVYYRGGAGGSTRNRSPLHSNLRFEEQWNC